MMIGNHPNSTVHVPPWDLPDDLAAGMPLSLSLNNSNANFNVDDFSPFLQNCSLSPIQDPDSDEDADLPVDTYACDHFRMFEFKVRKCARGRSHDWTDCPYAHPGEKARRRDPRKYHYSGTACPEFRKGYCKKGDTCEFAHGVFECWLHPSRYRTQPCKDGVNCTRRVCFFAHTPEQLRVLSPRTPESADSSPPVSPATNSLSRSVGSTSVSEMINSLRQLQLNKVKSMPKSWGLQMGFGSPRFSMTRPGFCSLPSTPTRAVTRTGIGYDEIWESEEPVMERVESGRDLRVRMFEKLCKENPLDRVDPNPNSSDGSNPDINWVSDLVK
ncbi:hypothetical protein LguiA_020080 [Lonicera macranthoides]